MSSAALNLWPTLEPHRLTLGREFDTALEEAEQRIDPIARLMDPTFTDVTWHYEGSRLSSPDIPGQLHQKQWDALKDPRKHRWLFWGNQVGKTTLACIDLVLLCLGRHPNQKWEPGVVCWASALTWELWENVLLPELLTWIPQDRIIGKAPEPYKRSTNRLIRIRADNGKESRIFGKAAEQGAKKYQSARVHRVLLDEEHPEAIFDELLPRLLRFGGDTIAPMTPLLGLTWVFDRVYEPWKQEKPEACDHYVSHAGLADNPSIPRESIESITRELAHNPAQLAARLYGHFMRPSGLVLPWDPDKHTVAMTDQEIRAAILSGECFGAVDFGLWRWAFTWGVANTVGELRLIDEIFSQRESADDRAVKMDAQLRHYGVREIAIMGDCANPQDILEINLALQRINSPYSIGAVHAENKIIAAGVTRVENMLNRAALTVRKGMGEMMNWNLGMNASKPGKPVTGSRFKWEIANWLYKKAKAKVDGDPAQKDEPDDNSADGADMMAALRYLIMSWFSKDTEPEKPRAPTILERLEAELRQLDAGELEESDQHTYRGGVLRQ